MFFQIIDRLSRLFQWVILTLTGIAIALLVPMMFLVAGDVIGRYVFKSPIPAVFEINSCFLMVLVVFFPMAYVHRRREHVFVTLFTDKFPARVKAALDTFSVFVGAVAFGLIGWYGMIFAVKATEAREYSPGIIDVPVWISKWIVPIGALAFCIELLLDGMKHLREIFAPPAE
ncbi:MAG: TRAP transporter small permease [Deltaproteobacteria bacterium]|nr:TRAP transporter small permease [Deltaproteobacteria bacterium]MBW1925305.1 TRAP transporter small permease [Deltaproteobacteria bacterium]MBW1950722.1 TRAP transporter small permease [Deltaproteobacteria bacterium]MBW2008786.1 TRAP transporter small permease [Deltaproteobacteria bacterium]MBW2102480.1 TRAP transporter small permease [Deltaproteobacteria bacterium]